MPRSYIAGPYGRFMFNFLGILHPDFHSGCTHSQSHQQWTRACFALNPWENHFWRSFGQQVIFAVLRWVRLREGCRKPVLCWVRLTGASFATVLCSFCISQHWIHDMAKHHVFSKLKVLTILQSRLPVLQNITVFEEEWIKIRLLEWALVQGLVSNRQRER